MRIPEQIQRLTIVIVIVVVGTLATRFYLIPRSIVDTDLHRAAAVARETAKPTKFAGASTCGDCHEDVAVKRSKSFHRNVSCETCHGPAAQHAEDPSAVKPPAPRDRKFCPVCHAYDPSRPTGFPQINVTAHNPLKACISCHNPHDPTPPKTPAACSACHGEIERTKAISSHALLPCTTCHHASEQHKRAPRTALPSVPQSREFCATCHGQAAPASATPAKEAPTGDVKALGKNAPKIDTTTHGGRYLCWQCHYPHLPEGRGA